MGVQKNKRSRLRKSMLCTKRVLSADRCKTLGFTRSRSVFAKDCAVMQRNDYINHEQRNLRNVTRLKKQFDLIRECVVKLERLSPGLLVKLSWKKEHQTQETRSLTKMHHRYENGNYFYFHNSSGKHCGTEEKTQGSVRFQQNVVFDKQNYHKWEDIQCDSCGNARYLRKVCGDSSESEEDWHGWPVHTDSVRNLHSAHLDGISDGVKKSCTVVWVCTIKPVTTTQNKAVQVPEQTPCVFDKKQYKKEKCAGFSFDDSDGDEAEFCGW